MTFQREDRYIVIKRKDLQHITAQSREKLDALLDVIPGQHRRYLVIESDWPEYKPAWAMIQARVSGKPLPQSEREAALQQRLNEADQRIDDLGNALARHKYWLGRAADHLENAGYAIVTSDIRRYLDEQAEVSQLTKDSPEVGS